MGLDKNLLFTDQYIEIQLVSIKENRKKQITTSYYSILIEQANSMFNPFSWFGNSIKKWPGDSWGYKVFNKWKSFVKGPELAELRRYVLTGQTQKWSGIKKFKEDFGFL